MTLSIIAAVASNGVIGRDGDLPWHLPADLARFKQLTMGHALIVGRKTYAEIGKPLPGRRMIMLSRTAPSPHPEVAVAADLATALRLAEGDDEVFVAGGAQIYGAALPITDRMYLTHVHADVPGDTRFPDYDPGQWERLSILKHAADDQHAYAFTFVDYRRLRA